MKISRNVYVGEMLPKFYGIAYLDYQRDYAFAYPVPINLIVRFGRWLWYEIVRYRPMKLDKLLHEAYEKGRSEHAQEKDN
jgi:hypothetical protein